MDVLGCDVHLVEEPIAQPLESALLLRVGHSQTQLAQVEGNHVAEAHFVGKIQFHEFAIHIHSASSGAKTYHAAPFFSNAFFYSLNHVARGIGSTFHRCVDNNGVNLLISCEGNQFHFAGGTVITLRHLVELDV